MIQLHQDQRQRRTKTTQKAVGFVLFFLLLFFLLLHWLNIRLRWCYFSGLLVAGWWLFFCLWNELTFFCVFCFWNPITLIGGILFYSFCFVWRLLFFLLFRFCLNVFYMFGLILNHFDAFCCSCCFFSEVRLPWWCSDATGRSIFHNLFLLLEDWFSCTIGIYIFEGVISTVEVILLKS